MFLLFSILLEYVRKKQKGDLKEGKIDLGVFFLFFMPFFLINVSSIFWTWGILSTLNELNVLVWVLATVYLFYITDRKEAALKAITLGAAVLGICAMIQLKVLFPKLIETLKGGRYADIASIQAIPFASFLYHNVFGGYMSFILPLTLYFGIYKKKLLFQIASIFTIAGIVLSTSRIAMGISFLFLIGFISFLVKTKSIKNILILLLIVAMAISVVFILIKTATHGEFKGLTAELIKKSKPVPSEIRTLNTRTEIWKNAFRAFIAHPVAGVGPGATELAYRRYFDGGIYTRYTHSVLLKILVELGIIGLICFLFYITGFIYLSWKKLKDYPYLFIFASALCGIFFGILDFSFDMPAHTITFFVLSSMAFLEERSKRLFTINGFLKKITITLMVIVILASFMFTARVCIARKSIEVADVLKENGFITDAYQAYYEAIKEMPLDNEGYIKSASILKTFYEIESDATKKDLLKNSILWMLEEMRKVKDLDSQLYFTMGLCYEALGIEKEAEDYLLKAVSFYPSSAHYVSELIRFYLVRNELEKADKWVEAVKAYFDRYRLSKNPQGFYVCKIRDMEAEIEFRKGNKFKALSIATDNLLDVINDRYIISNIKTGLIIPKEALIKYLKGRVDRFKQ